MLELDAYLRSCLVPLSCPVFPQNLLCICLTLALEMFTAEACSFHGSTLAASGNIVLLSLSDSKDFVVPPSLLLPSPPMTMHNSQRCQRSHQRRDYKLWRREIKSTRFGTNTKSADTREAKEQSLMAERPANVKTAKLPNPALSDPASTPAPSQTKPTASHATNLQPTHHFHHRKFNYTRQRLAQSNLRPS